MYFYPYAKFDNFNTPFVTFIILGASKNHLSLHYRVQKGLRPTQPPIQWVAGTLSLGVKRPGREADHSPPSSAEFKKIVELYLRSPVPLMAWCSVKKQHKDFTLPNLIRI